MSKVRVAAFSISLDGFGAGPRQDLQNPLGVRGLKLHTWFLQTEAFNKMHGQSGGKRGVDDDLAAQSFENIGAWILSYRAQSDLNITFVPFSTHSSAVAHCSLRAKLTLRRS